MRKTNREKGYWEDEKGYERQSGWEKKTNKKKRDGANVHE